MDKSGWPTGWTNVVDNNNALAKRAAELEKHLRNIIESHGNSMDAWAQAMVDAKAYLDSIAGPKG